MVSLDTSGGFMDHRWLGLVVPSPIPASSIVVALDALVAGDTPLGGSAYNTMCPVNSATPCMDVCGWCEDVPVGVVAGSIRCPVAPTAAMSSA